MKKQKLKTNEIVIQKTKTPGTREEILDVSFMLEPSNLFAYNIAQTIDINNFTPTKENEDIKTYVLNFKEAEELFGADRVKKSTVQKRMLKIQTLIKQQKVVEFKNGKKITDFIPIPVSTFDFEEKTITLKITQEMFDLINEFKKPIYHYFKMSSKETQTLNIEARAENRKPYTLLYLLLKRDLNKFNRNIVITYEKFNEIGWTSKTQIDRVQLRRRVKGFVKFLEEHSSDLNIRYKNHKTKPEVGIEFDVEWKKAYVTKEELNLIHKQIKLLKENNINMMFGSISEDKVSYDWNKPKKEPFQANTALVLDDKVIVLDFDKLDSMDYLKTLPEEVLNKGIEFVGGNVVDEFEDLDFLDFDEDEDALEDEKSNVKDDKNGLEGLSIKQLTKLREWAHNEFYEEWKKKAIVQKTNHGVHVLLRNDLELTTASTQMYYKGTRVDFRGLGNSYIKQYNYWEGQLNDFSKYFDLIDFRDANGRPKKFKSNIKIKANTNYDQQLELAEQQIKKEKHISSAILTAPLDGYLTWELEDKEKWFMKASIWNIKGYLHKEDFEKLEKLFKENLK